MQSLRQSECDDETRAGAPPAAKARLVVEAGRSDRNEWLFYPGTVVRKLVIGSSSSCGWRIVARGVRARHLRLCWRADRLSIVAQHAPGSVRVAGRRVAHGLDLVPLSTLELGEARLRFEPIDRAEDSPIADGTDDAVTPLVPRMVPAAPKGRGQGRGVWLSVLAFVRGSSGR
jgi:hypothetical protein